jgi:hypothetical protein
VSRVTGKEAPWAMELVGPDRLGGPARIGLHARVDADLHQIPGAEFDAELRLWIMPLSWAACVTARGVLGPDPWLGPELRRWIANEYERRVRPAMEARGTPVTDSCAECGLPRDWWRPGRVRDIRRDRIYCSNACRQRAWRRGHGR